MGGAAEVLRLTSGIGVKLGARYGGSSRPIPHACGHEATFGCFPEARASPALRDFGVRLRCSGWIVQLLAELCQAFEERIAGFRVVDVGKARCDDTRRILESACFLEESAGVRYGSVVVRRERGNSLPGGGRGSKIMSALFMQRSQLLLDRDLLFQIGLRRCLLGKKSCQVVPALGYIKCSGEGLLRIFVTAIDGDELPPGIDSSVAVVQLAFAERRKLA